MRMLSVETRWIDWNGGDGSPQDLFDRSGQAIADFLIHTLGWVQITQADQSFYDVSLDPRAIRAAAAERLVTWIEKLEIEPDRAWLMRIRAYTGHDWIEFSGTSADLILPMLRRLLQFGTTPDIPSALTIENRRPEDLYASLGHDVQEVLDYWRALGGRVSVNDPMIKKLLARHKEGSSVKLLSRDGFQRVVVGAYTPSTTTLWKPDHVAHFVGTPVVEAMPDRGLGAAVARSADATMQSREPQFQRWRGPLLRSDGCIVELGWDRLSLPLQGPGGVDAVLVVAQRTTPFQMRAAG